MKIDDQNRQEKIMHDLLINIHKQGVWLSDHIHTLSESELQEQREKIARLTMLFNNMITKREGHSNKIKSLYNPEPETEAEREELYRLIEE